MSVWPPNSRRSLPRRLGTIMRINHACQTRWKLTIRQEQCLKHSDRHERYLSRRGIWRIHPRMSCQVPRRPPAEPSSTSRPSQSQYPHPLSAEEEPHQILEVVLDREGRHAQKKQLRLLTIQTMLRSQPRTTHLLNLVPRPWPQLPLLPLHHLLWRLLPRRPSQRTLRPMTGKTGTSPPEARWRRCCRNSISPGSGWR